VHVDPLGAVGFFAVHVADDAKGVLAEEKPGRF